MIDKVTQGLHYKIESGEKEGTYFLDRDLFIDDWSVLCLSSIYST